MAMRCLSRPSNVIWCVRALYAFYAVHTAVLARENQDLSASQRIKMSSAATPLYYDLPQAGGLLLVPHIGTNSKGTSPAASRREKMLTKEGCCWAEDANSDLVVTMARSGCVSVICEPPKSMNSVTAWQVSVAWNAHTGLCALIPRHACAEDFVLSRPTFVEHQGVSMP